MNQKLNQTFLNEIFEKYDNDKDGYLQKSEIKEILQKELKYQNVNEEKINQIFSDLNQEKQKHLSFEEFQLWLLYVQKYKVPELLHYRQKILTNFKDFIPENNKKIDPMFPNMKKQIHEINLEFGKQYKNQKDIKHNFNLNASINLKNFTQKDHFSPKFVLQIHCLDHIDPQKAIDKLDSIIQEILIVTKCMIEDSENIVDSMEFDYSILNKTIIQVDIQSHHDKFREIYKFVKEIYTSLFQNYDNFESNFQFSLNLQPSLQEINKKTTLLLSHQQVLIEQQHYQQRKKQFNNNRKSFMDPNEQEDDDYLMPISDFLFKKGFKIGFKCDLDKTFMGSIRGIFFRQFDKILKRQQQSLEKIKFSGLNESMKHTEKQLKTLQKIEELKEIMYMFFLDSSKFGIKFGTIQHFQEEIGLEDFFKKNPYFPKYTRKNYKFIEMIKDAPIMAQFLDWFRNYCKFQFKVGVELEKDFKIEFDVQDQGENVSKFFDSLFNYY